MAHQNASRMHDAAIDDDSDGDSVDSLNEEPLLGMVDKKYLSDKRFADFSISPLSKR